MNCYLCGENITEKNITEEHIIPNALGGKLKSKELICMNCNSKFGESLDIELAKQMNIYANMLNIPRDRGCPPNVECVSEEGKPKYRIAPGGKPLLVHPYKVSEESGKIKFECPPHRLKDFKREIESRFAKENKKVEFEIGEIKSEQLKEPVTQELAHYGGKYFSALNKIAVNFYIYLKKESSLVQHIINELKNENDVFENIVLYSLESKKELEETQLTEVFHKLILKMDKEEKKIYVYIELFSSDCFLILLNDNYTGENYTKVYTYNVVSRAEKWFDDCVGFDYLEKEWLTQEDLDIKKIKLEKLLPFMLFKQEKDAFLEDFIKKSKEKYGSLTSGNIEEVNL